MAREHLGSWATSHQALASGSSCHHSSAFATDAYGMAAAATCATCDLSYDFSELVEGVVGYGNS